ncbi:MAG TPA: Hsp33 family molecular chaperone HslO [Casimicrobiaceae bacterium]
MTDSLTPFVLENSAVRGAHVSMPVTVREVLACHPYPPAVARVLGELLAACALLASTIKFEGSLIAQLSGDGPVRLLVVECTHALGMRAMAQWDDARTAALGPGAALSDLAGGPEHGRLVLTLDPKGAGTMYQGIVALESGSIAGLIEHYLATSEQLQSRMVLAAGGAGLIVQRLPGSSDADEATWVRVMAGLDAVQADDLREAASAHDAIAAAFPEDDVRVFKPRPVTFACSCSRERVTKALRIAGLAEVESILAERGSVEMTCEFCNRRYTFAPAEARAVFAADGLQ